MKRLFALLLCIALAAALFVSVVAPVASAEGEKCYIVRKGQQVEVVFLEEEGFDTNNARVVVPYDYTVTVLGEVQNGVVKCIYAGKSGKIAAADLAKMEISATIVELPQIEVKPKSGVPVYRIVASERREVSIDSTKHLYFLGTYSLNGNDYYAVRQEGDDEFIYYVLQNTVAEQNNQEIEDTLYPKPNVVSGQDGTANAVEEKKSKEFTWVRFVLILGIIIPFITILLMIIRPRSRVRRQYREVNDNDDDYDGIDEV